MFTWTYHSVTKHGKQKEEYGEPFYLQIKFIEAPPPNKRSTTHTHYTHYTLFSYTSFSHLRLQIAKARRGGGRGKLEK